MFLASVGAVIMAITVGVPGIAKTPGTGTGRAGDGDGPASDSEHHTANVVVGSLALTVTLTPYSRAAFPAGMWVGRASRAYRPRRWARATTARGI